MDTQYFRNILAALTLTLLAFNTLSAQTLTETLQKDFWNAQAPMTADDWANKLPGNEQDTLFQTDGQTAERFALDHSGLPTEVVLFIRDNGTWQPVTRTITNWDSHGNMTYMQSWTFADNAWMNESTTTKRLDDEGRPTQTILHLWEEGGWKVGHIYTHPQEDHLLGSN